MKKALRWLLAVGFVLLLVMSLPESQHCFQGLCAFCDSDGFSWNGLVHKGLSYCVRRWVFLVGSLGMLVATWLQVAQPIMAFCRGKMANRRAHGDARHLAKLLDESHAVRIMRQEWKQRDSTYVPARMYCSESSARVRAERRISLYSEKSADVIMLLSASSCGRRAVVSGALLEKLYPVYVMHSALGDANDIRGRIEKLIGGLGGVRSFTVFVSVKKNLCREGALSLFLALQHLMDEEKSNGIALRIVISATCLGKVESEGIYYLQPLNAQEAMSLLRRIDESHCKANGKGVSPLALYAERSKGQVEKGLLDYSMGNPGNVARFWEACADMNGTLLSSYEKDFDKRVSYLCSDNKEDELRLFLLVANVILALRFRGLEKCDLKLLIDVLSENQGGPDLRLRLRKMVAAAFSLDADVAVNPFDLRQISANETFVSSFIDRRGRSDLTQYAYGGTWQQGFRAILFDERIRSYREDYCYALVQASLLANLNNALPGNRSVSPAYGVVNSVIWDMRASDACEGNQFICSFVQSANEMIAQEIQQFLSGHCSVIEPVEMVQMISAAIGAWEPIPVEYVEQLSDYLIYFLAYSSNPYEWGLNADVVGRCLLAAIEHGGERGADASYSFGVYVLLSFSCEREYVLFEHSETDKWIDMARNAVSSAAAGISSHLKGILGKLGMLDGDFASQESLGHLIKDAETVVSAIESANDFSSRAEFGFLLFLAGASLSLLAKDDRALDWIRRIRVAISGKGRRVEAGALQSLDRLAFGISLSRALELPPDPKPEDFTKLYENIRAKMDLESARMGIDGEVRASFLANVVISIQSYLIQFRDNARYEAVLRHALLKLGAEIEDRFVEFTYRQRCALLLAFAPFLPNISMRLKQELSSVFEALMLKIPRSGEPLAFISSNEFDAFTSSAGFAVNDPDFFASRISEVVPRVVFSPLLDCFSENYKILWMERLFPTFSLQDPGNILVRMVSLAVGPERMADLRENGSETLTPGDLLSYAIRNRRALSQKILCATDGIVLSMLRTFLSSWNRIKSSWPEEAIRTQVKSWTFVLSEYAVPMLTVEAYSGEDQFFHQMSVACVNVMLALEKSGLLDAADAAKVDKCGDQLLNSMEFRRFAELNEKNCTDARQYRELVRKAMSTLDPLGRLERESLMADAWQRAETLGGPFDDPSLLDELFRILQDSKAALSEEALMDGGYGWYDNSLVRLFICNDDFVLSHKDELLSLSDYLEQELPKHNGREFADCARRAFQRAKRIISRSEKD